MLHVERESKYEPVEGTTGRFVAFAQESSVSWEKAQEIAKPTLNQMKDLETKAKQAKWFSFCMLCSLFILDYGLQTDSGLELRIYIYIMSHTCCKQACNQSNFSFLQGGRGSSARCWLSYGG